MSLRVGYYVNARNDTNTIMENLGIDTKLLIAQLINFLLFIYVFRRFISAPFLKFVTNEKKKDEEKQKAMSEIKKIEENLANMETEARKKGKKEADIMISQAKQDAEHVKKEIIEQAQKEAAAIIEKSKKLLDEEKVALYKEVKEKAAHLSTVMIEKALNNYLTEDVQKELTHHILTNLSKDQTVN